MSALPAAQPQPAEGPPVTGGRRPISGRKPGDRRVRVERPHSAYFRYTGPNQLVAKPEASLPRSGIGRTILRWKAWLIGRPLASEEEIGERLSKRLALPIFSSDAISSSAYATEEILRVLMVGGGLAFLFSIQVAAAIAVLLAVVAVSYRQVCRAFPNGGGAYAVARQELTPLLGLVAAAALLIDYVMTVAVSTSSAVEQLISISPGLNAFRIEFALGSIALITIANLRGLRESGNIFAVPTYLFVTLALAIVGIGLVRIVTGQAAPVPPQPEAMHLGSQAIGLVLLLKAFASGSVALTGTEAIANGVPAFRPPEARNAANTLVAMAVLLAVLFIGITVVASAYHIVPSEEGSGGPTVIALVAQTAFGTGSPLFYVFQLSTALILFLAANTSYNAFPRLAALLARDGYMPRQFAFRGDRLAFSWGIVLLSAVAGALLVRFGGVTTDLIPLYSVGVFVCFTLSQGGMVLHWRRHPEPGWRGRMAINAFGAMLTAIVLAIVVYEKFAGGAYLVVILIPLLVGTMLFINRQYAASNRQLAVAHDYVVPVPRREQRAIIPVPSLNRAVVRAINVARSITHDVSAVYISEDPDHSARMRSRWEHQVPDVPLVIVESPYRALAGPLVAYLDVLDRAWPPDKADPITFVVVPEYVARHWWERLLYNQSARRLRTILLGRPHTVVVDVPYRRDDPAEEAELARPVGPDPIQRAATTQRPIQAHSPSASR
jgi:amino acid transporter